MDKFGWNNIGILLKDLAGVEESDLLVRVKGVYHENTEVFLGIPSLKVLERGTFASDKNEYFFYTPDGKIPLSQGVPAYIVVRSENDGQALFGKAKWIMGRQQLLSAEQTPMSPEDIAHAIHELPFDTTNLQTATASDTTGVATGNAGSASAAGGGTTDSSATASATGAAAAGSQSSASGAGDPGTAGSTGDASVAGSDAGTGSAGGSPGDPRRAGSGKRRARRAQQAKHLLACPCWCDEMDYRKADSIARAAGAGQ
jgi:hypothetical protein